MGKGKKSEHPYMQGVSQPNNLTSGNNHSSIIRFSRRSRDNILGSYSYTKSTKSIHTKVPYSSWVKLFKLHAQGYNVLDLIDGTLAPAKIDTTYES